MCGIAGHINFNGLKGAIIGDCVTNMINTMVHRGPDDSGILNHNNVSLGHRRLSIIDLSQLGHQPMISEEKDFAIVFNGEIYNFKELRSSLETLGYIFKSESDTEVILAGFKYWHTDLFLKLNGIFSFAILNLNNQELYLVRDRLGIKPLYYYHNAEGFYFSSEIKAIRKVCPELNEINFEALNEFTFYGNALGQKTLFKSINALNPGTYIRVKGAEISNHVYWRPEDIRENFSISSTEAVEQVRNYLELAVKRQLISDVPVGVFLSGGIDSSAITAFAKKHYSGKLKTFAAAFDFDKGVNELDKARFVANHFDTEHTELFIKGSDLPDIVEQMIYHHDEPFSDAANIPLFLMAKQVKPFATVVLQGDGGDELFGGYNRYFLLDKYSKGYKKNLTSVASSIFGSYRGKNSLIRRGLRIANAISQKDDAMMMALLLTTDTLQNNTKQMLTESLLLKLSKYNPFEYYQQTVARFSEKSLLQKMLYTDTQIILPNTFLEKVDKSTMAASIEVRVPFLDYDLVDFVMSLPASIKIQNGEKKYLLKKALRGVLPDQILDGPKTGFGVPYENWLKGPLYDFMNDKLRSDYIKQLGLFNYKLLDKRIKDHKENKVNYGFQLWKMMNLSIWLEKNKISLK